MACWNDSMLGEIKYIIKINLNYFFTFKRNPHPRICLLILEKGEGRGREREREMLTWERNNDQLPPICTLTRDLTHSPATCSDWGSNLQPFGVQDDTPTNRATQPGLFTFFWCDRWKTLKLNCTCGLYHISTGQRCCRAHCSPSSQRDLRNLGWIMCLFGSQSFKCSHLTPGKSQVLTMAFKALHDPLSCFLADLPSFHPLPCPLVPAILTTL